MRIHLDENIGSAIAVGLRRRGVDVTTTPELGLRGASDETQLATATQMDRSILTFDADFVRLHHQGVSHAGILYCAGGKLTIGQLVREIETLATTASAEDMHDVLYYL